MERRASWFLLLLASSFGISIARWAPDAAEVLSACLFAYTLKLDLPDSNHHGIRASDFQRKAWDYYLGEPIGPPIEESFWLLALPEEFQQDVTRECAAMLAMAYLIVAETQLYLVPDQAREYLETGVSIFQNIEKRTREMVRESWPLDLAIQHFQASQLSLKKHQDGMAEHYRVDFVLAHCKEDLAWLEESLLRWDLVGFARLFIYEKCGEETSLKALEGLVPTKVEQVIDHPGGRKDECSAYLTHCLNVARAGDWATYTVFLQSDAFVHTRPRLLNLVMESAKQGTLDITFLHLGNTRMVSSTSTCKRAIVEQVLARREDGLPRSYCCAQFAVRSTAIAENLPLWERAMEALDAPMPPGCEQVQRRGMHCLVYEGIWHAMYGRDIQLRARYEDTALPIFLRIQENDASDLPSGPNSTLYLRNAVAQDVPWLDDLGKKMGEQRDSSGAPSIGYTEAQGR